jgi:hypothetical protein
MKTITAFRALRKNRLASSSESKPYKVRSVNKDGTISKAQVTSFCEFATKGQAEVAMDQMSKLNPGRQFAVTFN